MLKIGKYKYCRMAKETLRLGEKTARKSIKIKKIIKYIYNRKKLDL